MRSLTDASILLLLLSLPRSLPAAEGRFIIVQPGYPGSTDEARLFIAELSAAIAGAGGPDLAGEYHNEAAAALQAIEKDRPALGIVSLGFFLAQREKLKLEPLLASRPEERFYLAAKKGEPIKPQELAGKSVAGTSLLEPEFVARILFGRVPDGKGGAGEAASDATLWNAEARGFSKSVRDAARGRVRAVLLTEREKRSLESLEVGKELEIFHRTEAYPAALVVSLGGGGSGGGAGGGVPGSGGPGGGGPGGGGSVAAKGAAALGALASKPEGKRVLETMGLEGFAPVDPKRIAGLVEAFDAAGKVKGPAGGKKEASGGGR